MIALLLATAMTPHEHAERALGMLTYIAGDYESAVGAEGKVISEEELAEQTLFAHEAASDLTDAGTADLAAGLSALGDRVAAKAEPREVILLARQLETRIEQRFQLAVLPPREPRPARALYRQACAACHGADGVPARRDLSTLPPDLSSKSDVARLSPRRIFAAVTYGVPGTAMPAYGDAIPVAERWDLAWYVLSLSHQSAAERRRGRELLAKLPRRPDYLQLAIRTDEQLRKVLAGSRMTDADREAILTACREAR
jgi:high-affinity iron transporter